jgi:hypothetical protein
MSIFYDRPKGINNHWGSTWLCIITKYKRGMQSAPGVFGVLCGAKRLKYKVIDKIETKVMEHMDIVRATLLT